VTVSAGREAGDCGGTGGGAGLWSSWTLAAELELIADTLIGDYLVQGLSAGGGELSRDGSNFLTWHV